MKTKQKAKSKQVKKQKVEKRIAVERESVKYNFNAKSFSINAESNIINSVNNKSASYKAVISKADVQELIKRKDDKKAFYSYCNADVKLLSALHVDSASKKLHECTNTQYDSRKKLNALIQQIALSSMKQRVNKKAKAKK